MPNGVNASSQWPPTMRFAIGALDIRFVSRWIAAKKRSKDNGTVDDNKSNGHGNNKAISAAEPESCKLHPFTLDRNMGECIGCLRSISRRMEREKKKTNR